MEAKRMAQSKAAQSNDDIEVVTNKKKVRELLQYIESKEIQTSSYTPSTYQPEEPQYSEVWKKGDAYKKGDDSVLPQLLENLASDDTQNRMDVYNSIHQFSNDTIHPGIRHKELSQAILANLSKESDQMAIVNLLRYSELEGETEALHQLLISGEFKREKRLIFLISSKAKEKKSLDYIVGKLMNNDGNLFDIRYLFQSLETFARNGDASMKSNVVKHSKKIVGQFVDMENPYNENRVSAASTPLSIPMRMILQHGGKENIPFAKKCIAHGILFDDAIKALARWGDKDIGNLLKERLSQAKTYNETLPYAKEYYLEHKDKEMLDGILKGFEISIPRMNWHYERFISTLKEIGQESQLQKMENFVSQPEIIETTKKIYVIKNGNHDSFAKELLDMGLISQAIPKEKLELNNSNEYGTINQYVYQVLEESGISHWFDAEPGMVPVDYDVLFHRLIQNTDNRLSEAKVRMDTQVDGDGQVQYDIYLYWDERVFIGHPSDIGDWYQVGFVISIFNKALEASGMKERFVSADTGDQTALLIFGEPEKIYYLLAKYRVGF